MNISSSSTRLVQTFERKIFTLTLRNSPLTESWLDNFGYWSLILNPQVAFGHVIIDIKTPISIQNAFVRVFYCKGDSCHCSNAGWGFLDTGGIEQKDYWINASTPDNIFTTKLSIKNSYRSQSNPQILVHLYFRWYKELETIGVESLLLDLEGFYIKSEKMTAVGPCNSSHQNEGSMEQADGRIYEDVSLYDFNFVIIAKGEPKRCFRTNKTLLKVRSPYFRKMLEGEWKESSENETNLKYDAEVIRGMLEFIHTGLLSSVSPVFADEWLALADQLDSNEFKDLVQAGLSNSLNVDNAVTLLCLAHLHKASDLYVNVTAFLHKNAAGVIRNWPTRNLAS